MLLGWHLGDMGYMSFPQAKPLHSAYSASHHLQLEDVRCSTAVVAAKGLSVAVALLLPPHLLHLRLVRPCLTGYRRAHSHPFLLEVVACPSDHPCEEGLAS